MQALQEAHCPAGIFFPALQIRNSSPLYSLFFNDGLPVAPGFFNDELLFLGE